MAGLKGQSENIIRKYHKNSHVGEKLSAFRHAPDFINMGGAWKEEGLHIPVVC